MAFSVTPALQPGSAAQYQGKNRSPKSLTFDAAQQCAFGDKHDVAASQAESIVLDVFPLAQAAKVLRVGITAQAVSGTPHIQITTTPTTTNPTTGLLPVGVSNNGVTVACNNYLGQTIACAAPDLTLPSGTVLALRVTTGAGDTVTGLRTTIELANRDEHPGQPLLHAFNEQSY